MKAPTREHFIAAYIGPENPGMGREWQRSADPTPNSRLKRGVGNPLASVAHRQ